jgi:hypothetical protein
MSQALGLREPCYCARARTTPVLSDSILQLYKDRKELRDD